MFIMDTNVFSLFFLVLVVKESRSEPCANSAQSLCTLIVKSSETSILTCPCPETMDCEKLKWIDKGGQDIKRMGPGSNSKMYTELNGRELVLFIQSMSKSKTGIYKCVAAIDGRDVDVITRSVIAYDPLIFLNWNKTQNITMGRDSHIDCHVRSDTLPRFQWYKGEDELVELTDGDKYEIDSTGLKVKNVTNEDSGIYKCTATEERIGELFDNIISVEVFRVPTITNLDAIPDATVILGDELTIECEADGYPLPSYSWKKISYPATTANNTNVTWVQDLNKIIFENVTENDRGTYECIARNDAGEDKTTVTIEVLSPPKITHFVNMTVPEGIEAKLTCKASGRPRPKIVMTFESEKSSADVSLPYSVNDTKETDTELNIIFSEVHRNYEGYFYCNATNNVSDAIEAAYLKVWYKPYFENYIETVWAWKDQTVNLSCENDAYPEAQIKWSYHGSNETTSADHIEVSKFLLADINTKSYNYIFPINFTRSSYYGTYMCTAFNSYGEANKTFYVREGFAPSQLEDITVSNTTASSATFIIEIPPHQGPNITAIRAEYDEADNYNVTHIHQNRTWPIYRPIRLNGLKHSTTYLIKFTAQNNVGSSPFSEIIEFETPEKSIPEPLEMEHDYIEMPSNSEPVLNLKIPHDNGEPIDYYAIKYCPEVKEEQRPCIEQKIPVTSVISLNHLDLNTTYLVEVTVHNALGNSAPTSFFLRMPETVPGSEQSLLSAGATIAISVVVVVLCIVLLDALLYFTRKQGMIASCCHKKNKKRKEDTLHSRDKKGLLKDNAESGPDDAVKRADNGHKEFEYNKTTGVITGKHSAV